MFPNPAMSEGCGGLSSLQPIDRFDAVGALVFRRVHLPADAVEFELAVEVVRQKDLRFDRRPLSGIKPGMECGMVENYRIRPWIRE